MQLPKVINNISERVVDDLKQKLSDGSRVSIAAAQDDVFLFIDRNMPRHVVFILEYEGAV